jgi:hypothetical protein
LGVGPVLAGFTERLWDETGKGLRFFGTPTPAWLGLKRRFGHKGQVVGQCDMNQQANQHERDQQELVKQRIESHGAVPFS